MKNEIKPFVDRFIENGLIEDDSDTYKFFRENTAWTFIERAQFSLKYKCEIKDSSNCYQEVRKILDKLQQVFIINEFPEENIHKFIHAYKNEVEPQRKYLLSYLVHRLYIDDTYGNIPDSLNFCAGIDLLYCWNSHFISYSNNGCQDINKYYEKCISPCNKLSFNSQNLVAEKLAKLLKSPQKIQSVIKPPIKVFYDQKWKIPVGGSLTKEIIIDNCRYSHVMIQLLNKAMFFENDTEINWCHREYLAFQQSVDHYKHVQTLSIMSRVKFYLADEELLTLEERNNQNVCYCNWIADFKNPDKKCVKLYEIYNSEEEDSLQTANKMLIKIVKDVYNDYVDYYFHLFREIAKNLS